MGALSDDDDELDFEDDMPPPPRPQPSQSRAMRSSAQHRGGAPNDIFAFANMCCEEFELTDTLKNDVLRSAQLPLQQLLVRTYARVLSFGQHVKQSNVSSFLGSAVFKDHITRRLQCSLLDPNLLFYVKGTTVRFVKHIIANPALYQIPLAVQEHFMHTKEFSAAVGEVFSCTRSEIRRKTEKASDERADIYLLCQMLGVRGFQFTEEHPYRIALMRVYLDQYNKIVWPPKDKTKKHFWEWLDDKLTEFYKLSPEAQHEKLEKNLRKDKKRYPIPPGGVTGFPSIVHPPDWQSDVSVALVEMLDDFYTNQNLLTEAQDTNMAAAQTVGGYGDTGGGGGSEGAEGGNGGNGEDGNGDGGDGGDGGDSDGNGDGDDDGDGSGGGKAGEGDGDGESGGGGYDGLDHQANNNRVRQSTAHSHLMDVDNTMRGVGSSSNGAHRRSLTDSVSPIRTNPSGSRPSPLHSRNGTPPLPAMRRNPTRPGKGKAGTQPSQPSPRGLGQSLGSSQTPYNPTGSETAMATVGYGGW